MAWGSNINKSIQNKALAFIACAFIFLSSFAFYVPGADAAIGPKDEDYFLSDPNYSASQSGSQQSGGGSSDATPETIATDILSGITDLPGLLSAAAYLMGLIFAVTGVFKLKDHVENPNQTPARAPLIRLGVGGTLFSLPVLYNAMYSSFSQGWSITPEGKTQLEGGSESLGAILINIANGLGEIPAFIAVFSYLLALVLGVGAILKLKAHVENPDQTPIREVITRLMAGGALFGMPSIYNAMHDLYSKDSRFGQATGLEGDSGLQQIMTYLSQDLVSMQGFVAVMGYLLGLIIGVQGVLMLKQHVENPSQVPLRTPVIRFIIGGAFLALPTVFNAIETLVNGGERTEFDNDTGFSMVEIISKVGGVLGEGIGASLWGQSTNIGTPDMNGVMVAIENSLSGTENLLIGVCYLLATVISFAALLKLKEHVEEPDRNPMREAVVRFIVGGALFALPTIFDMAMNLITGGEGLGAIANIVQSTMIVNWTTSSYADGNVLSSISNMNMFGTLGAGLRNILISTLYAPVFLNSLAYIFGLVLIIWGIFKARDHVQNPSQTNIWESVSRLVAGGAFFALPVTIEAIRSSVTPTTSSGVNAVSTLRGSAYNEQLDCNGTSFIDGAQAIGGFIGIGKDKTDAGGQGMDMMLGCLMSDVLAPMHGLLSFFGYVAGTIFIMIGISRLTKSAQEGARGPGGLGTFMTFITGGALISFNDMIKAVTFTLFGADSVMGTKTYANLSYDAGMDAAAQMHALTVISAILKFMIIVGLISFIRGIFIIRNVAEGNGQASMMAGITHLVAGAIAINLGAFIEMVQSTLGISGYGLSFGVTSGGFGGFLNF